MPCQEGSRKIAHELERGLASIRSASTKNRYTTSLADGRPLVYPSRRMVKPSTNPRLLLVDPSAELAGLRERLTDRGYEVSPAGPIEAIQLVDTEQPAGLLIVGAPQGASADLLAAIRRLRDQDEFVPVIVILSESDSEKRVRCLRDGADECLDAPVTDDELIARIDALLRIKGIQDRMHRSRRQLQRLSTTDALTGLLNQRHFEERARDELQRAKRYRDQVALLVLDLDGYGRVAAEHGDEVGAEVLRAFSRLIIDAVRDVDLAGRLSGDTFAILLPQTHLSGGLTAAERIRRAVAFEPFHVRGLSMALTVSIGVAFYPSQDVATHEDLLRIAREALYQARKQGPGKVGLYQGAHYVYDQVDEEDLDGVDDGSPSG